MATYWTIQTMEKWHEVQRLGYLTADINYIWDDFIDSYHWMMEQMEKQLPNYEGEYPIWVWTERPDLRRSAHLEKGMKGVLLKIELDEQDVLLSDFQAWHVVLNRTYFDLELDEDVRIIEDDEIEKSWEMIFELNTLKQHPNWGPSLDLQGVTGKISIEKIKYVKKFIAR